MFWISKLVGAFVTLPGLLVVIAVLLTRSIYKQRQKTAKFSSVFILTLLYLLSIEPTAEWLMRPLENWYSPLHLSNANAKAGHIVVLGGGTIENSPEYNGDTVLASEPLKRVDYAIYLQKHFNLPIIFSGGLALSSVSKMSEAEVAKQYCLRRGVASSALLIEPLSRNTDENASETQRIYNPQRIILVTSAYHMPRAMLIFSNYAMDTIPAPTDYKINNTGYTVLSFLPDKHYLHLSMIAAREYVGLAFYWVAKTIRNMAT